MRIICALVGICMILGLAGCATVSAPYVMKTDRLDQKVEGNRGYLKGTPPPAEDLTGRQRPWIAIDVDLPNGAAKESVTSEKTTIRTRTVTTEERGTPISTKETITTVTSTEENIK